MGGMGFGLHEVTRGFGTSLVVLCYATPYMLPVFAVLVVPAVAMYLYFQRSYREMNRLASILRSPATSHMNESLNGVSSIRAFRSANRFIARQHLLTDRSGKSSLIQQNTAYWFILRVEFLASPVILSVLLLAGAGVVSSAAVGLALVSSINLGDAFKRVLMGLSDAEVALNSVERLGHYVYDLPAEADQKDGPDTPPDW
ncbi:hypothetical protein HKX48_008207, partial [Thoreauomyces humboldtii]